MAERRRRTFISEMLAPLREQGRSRRVWSSVVRPLTGRHQQRGATAEISARSPGRRRSPPTSAQETLAAEVWRRPHRVRGRNDLAAPAGYP